MNRIISQRKVLSGVIKNAGNVAFKVLGKNIETGTEFSVDESGSLLKLACLFKQ